ncbi:hypothetical protein GW17_00040220 [Ensete ventricosum]|nr:hypothetical protein GW17_00040220 [Ensete ventricosum]
MTGSVGSAREVSARSAGRVGIDRESRVVGKKKKEKRNKSIILELCIRDEKGWIPRARRRRRRARGRGEELEVEVVVDVVERRRGRRPSGPPGDGGGERAEETPAEGIGSGIRRTWVGQPIVGRIASLDDLSFARFNSLAAVEARRRTNGGRFNPSDKAVPPPRLSVSLW